MDEQGSEVTVQVRENGPYLLEGSFRLVDAEGNAWDRGDRPTVALCRCGHSDTKPFCDGTHSQVEFQAPSRAL